VFGGWLADVAGYQTTFVVSAVCALVMAGALWLFVEDPAKRQVLPLLPEAEG
jgi:predicted MFS family arabinose efflux permease